MTLFRKYVLIFSLLTGGSLLVSSFFSIGYSYRENKQSLIRLQREKAEAAATRLGEYMFGIEQRIAVTALTSRSTHALEQRSLEVRLLKQTRAIREITLIDARGREYLRLSRRAPEVQGSGRDFSTAEAFRQAHGGRPYRSPIYFHDNVPSMTLAMAVGPAEAGITVAEIDLEFLLDGISRIQVGESGHAYAVDATGRLIAHPDIGLVLKNTRFADLPQVREALDNPTSASTRTGLLSGRSYEGEPVLTAFGAIPQLGWFVFVEEPLATAYRPLYAQALRSALIGLTGVLLTVIACVILARRLVRPIQALQTGAGKIGGGALDHRISVRTGDELEELADSFNRMAERLQTAVVTLEETVAERTQALQESNEKLAALSTTDGLTGIANRRRFDHVLLNEWQRAARTGQPLALAMLDVDWFKLYNDHYGHQAGDECLRQVACVLASTICRTGDLVARYGGEEFVFIAPATDAESALLMARKVGDALAALALPHALSEFGHITASIGVAAGVPDARQTPENLLVSADRALYRAKAEGRNRVVLA